MRTDPMPGSRWWKKMIVGAALLAGCGAPVADPAREGIQTS
jgi:hypothetical protein